MPVVGKSAPENKNIGHITNVTTRLNPSGPAKLTPIINPILTIQIAIYNAIKYAAMREKKVER